jgi:RNA polymerase sigma-70 factor (ECF subfamily)
MVRDDELVYEILKGSQASMEVLVKRYYKPIFAYVYRNIGDYHMAYDIAQEIFIKMMKYIKNYREQGKFKSWLFRIAYNTCSDYYRSSSYKRSKTEECLDEDAADNGAGVLDLLERDLERQRVRDAVLKLPEYQRNGYGKQLIEYSFERATALGYDVIVIFGNPDNYVSRGFKSCKKYNVCLENGTYPSAMMVKTKNEVTLFREEQDN